MKLRSWNRSVNHNATDIHLNTTGSYRWIYRVLHRYNSYSYMSGGSSEKCESIGGDFFISRLPSPKPETGVYKWDWWRQANYLCSHCFMWPGTIKSWLKPSPGPADQLHTLSFHRTHAYTSGGKAQKGVMYSAPKNGRGYETFSLKEGQPCDNTRIRILVNESLK